MYFPNNCNTNMLTWAPLSNLHLKVSNAVQIRPTKLAVASAVYPSSHEKHELSGIYEYDINHNEWKISFKYGRDVQRIPNMQIAYDANTDELYVHGFHKESKVAPIIGGFMVKTGAFNVYSQNELLAFDHKPQMVYS